MNTWISLPILGVHHPVVNSRGKNNKMEDIENIKQAISGLAKAETDLIKERQQFLEENKDFSERMNQLDEAQSLINKQWSEIKTALSKIDYTDTIDLPLVKLTVAKVVGVEVVDIDKVPEEFVETKKVPIEAKIKDFAKLYGHLPDGCYDKSYYRLTKKLKEA